MSADGGPEPAMPAGRTEKVPEGPQGGPAGTLQSDQAFAAGTRSSIESLSTLRSANSQDDR
jgi:hypothetical protein